MRSRIDLTLHMLDRAHDLMIRNVQEVSLEEALFVPVGGYRSILGTLKHAAAWSHIYRSYAFDKEPFHWPDAGWPRGLRDTIHLSEAYLSEVIEWFEAAHQLWRLDLQQISDEQLDELRPLHWGEQAPLFDIVAMIAHHHVYHAGEINQVLSISRGEAWEEGEEVEENNVSTIGHRVRPPWLD
jgi:uncharacterized damage-inducible protein DinB